MHAEKSRGKCLLQLVQCPAVEERPAARKYQFDIIVRPPAVDDAAGRNEIGASHRNHRHAHRFVALVRPVERRFQPPCARRFLNPALLLSDERKSLPDEQETQQRRHRKIEMAIEKLEGRPDNQPGEGYERGKIHHCSRPTLERPPA